MNIFTLFLTQPLTNALVLFYHLFGNNLGLAIIGLSIFIRLALNPITKPALDNMKKMREYQKDIEKLKKKHKGDTKKLMEAQQQFYKDKGINPSAGCLPQILQLVILISLFHVFRTTLDSNIDVIAKLNTLLYEPLRFGENIKLNTTFLFWDVTRPDSHKLSFLPFAIPGVLLFLSSFFQFVSAKMAMPYVEIEKKIAKKTKQETDDIAVAMQSSMIYTFPLMTLVIGLSFPAGLALYWLVFSISQAYMQFQSAGFGGLTPFLKKISLLK